MQLTDPDLARRNAVRLMQARTEMRASWLLHPDNDPTLPVRDAIKAIDLAGSVDAALRLALDAIMAAPLNCEQRRYFTDRAERSAQLERSRRNAARSLGSR